MEQELCCISGYGWKPAALCTDQQSSGEADEAGETLRQDSHPAPRQAGTSLSASLGTGSPLLRRPGAGDQAEPVHRLAPTCPSPWGSRAQPRTRSPLSTFRQPPGWERDRPEPPADWSEERCIHLRAALQRTNPPSNTASHLFSSVTCNHMARFPAEIRTPPGFVSLVGSRRVPFKPKP